MAAMAKERLFIGLHCGWAGDGVDAALAVVTGRGERMKVRQLATLHEPFAPNLRRKLLAAACEGAPPERLAELDGQITSAFAASAEKLIAQSKTRHDGIVAVGFSQQPLAAGGSGAVALGCPAAVARAMRLPVAAGAATAGGGAGAALAWPNWLVFHDARLSRVVVRLGGLAEVTFVPAAAQPGDVIAFDAGPCGLILDALAESLLKQPADFDGSAAAAGKVSPSLLNELLAAPYFQFPPPKYSAASEWGSAYVQRLAMAADRHSCGGADVLATATELVARVIAAAVGRLTERPHEVILCGGGSRNIHLAGRIRALLSPSSTYAAERYGFDALALAAAGWAILAACRVDERRTGPMGAPGGLWLA